MPITLQHFGPPLGRGDCEGVAGGLGQSPLPLGSEQGLLGKHLGLLIHVHRRVFVHDDVFTHLR